MQILEVFPKELIEDEGFQADLRSLFALSKKQVDDLKTSLPDSYRDIQDGMDLQERAKHLGVSESTYKGLAAIASMIRSRISTFDEDPSEIIDKCVEYLQSRLDSNVRDSLVELLRPSPKARKISRSAEAFFFGNSYRNCTFKPLLVPEVGEEHLIGGCLTVNYLNADKEPDSLAINMSIFEVEEFKNALVRFSEQLEKLEIGLGDESKGGN